MCRADGKKLAEAYARHFPSAQPAADGAAPLAAAGSPPLLALFKENLAVTPTTSELRDFVPFISGGQLLLHSDRSLYKALNQPALGISAFFSWSLISKFRSDQKLFGGNMKGEGMVKGAIFVIGNREQGILASYLEELGTEIDFKPIEAAMEQIKNNKAAPPAAAAQAQAPAEAAAASSSAGEAASKL